MGAICLNRNTRAGDAATCSVELAHLQNQLDALRDPVLGVGPFFPPDRNTEVRLVISSLQRAAHNLYHLGQESRCLLLADQARAKLKRLQSAG